MKKALSRLVKSRSGATAIEYGLIAALISVVCIVALASIGVDVNDKFESVSGALG